LAELPEKPDGWAGELGLFLFDWAGTTSGIDGNFVARKKRPPLQTEGVC